MKKIFSLSCLFLFSISLLNGCTKTYAVAKPTKPYMYKQNFANSPNDLYYALRWALRTYGYPIAEEDLQNGVIKSHYVPVRAYSHYVPLYIDRKDYGANGAYHQLEVRLVPKSGNTEVMIGSRIQSIVVPMKSSGTEEHMILDKVADYLRSANVQVTNVGLQQ
ncbi:MAG: hypothetical protein Q7T03_07310 [Deltaproteobacteria bacterium]|nr:hypothetical protein [Deltaproteobacteria bacterium]